MASQSAESLQSAFGIANGVTFSQGQGDLVKATLTADAGSAELYIQGAHITDFTPQGQKPVLFMSAASEFAQGRPIRGGVPICWPWFGAPTAGDGPGHGFARLSEWTVVDTTRQDDGRVSITLTLHPNEQAHRWWDQPYHVEFKVTVSDTLEMALTTRHTGTADSEPFTYSEALHSYFSVADIHKVTITGLEHSSYQDKLREGGLGEQGDEPIHFEGETDRVYQGPSSRIYQGSTSTCVIHDPGFSRRIVIEKEGSKSTVVWNPWVGKASRMEDFGDNEWPHMVCVETANAREHSMTLKPGESHTIVARLRSEAE